MDGYGALDDNDLGLSCSDDYPQNYSVPGNLEDDNSELEEDHVVAAAGYYSRHDEANSDQSSSVNGKARYDEFKNAADGDNDGGSSCAGELQNGADDKRSHGYSIFNGANDFPKPDTHDPSSLHGQVSGDADATRYPDFESCSVDEMLHTNSVGGDSVLDDAELAQRQQRQLNGNGRAEAIEEDHETIDFSAMYEDGFDEEFQTLMKIIEPDTSILKEADTFSQLSCLVSDFTHAALTYARVIISEKHLKNSEKSIKPITKVVKGFAGGEKYCCGNIFFRLPTDNHDLYRGEEYAAKEANHQLKGLTALYNADVGFSLPLLAVVKYHGYKLVAMSILPIKGQKTLCFGSSDAGKSFKMVDGQDLIKKAANMLNLREHPVRTRKGAAARTHFPCDMEVHRVAPKECGNAGQDRRFYAVDFSRLFPPQPPPVKMGQILGGSGRPNLSATHLYYLLRPELVRLNKVPLSSDAFTNFAARNSQEYNLDVEHATQRLIEEVIPDFAKSLDARPIPTTGNAIGKMLTKEMHAAGINMRFLGQVFKNVREKGWKREILVESVARVLKAHIRGILRKQSKQKVRTAVLTQYAQEVVTFLNHISGRTRCINPGEAMEEDCCCSFDDTSSETIRKSLNGLDEGKRLKRQLRSVVEHEINQSESADEHEKRQLLWCKRIPSFLKERFTFIEELRPIIMEMESATFPKPSCLCCVCLWKRVVPREKLIWRLLEVCGIELTPASVQACEDALIGSSQQQGTNGNTIFDRYNPFQEYDIQNFKASIHLLPIMEYAQGTSSLIRSKLFAKAGNEEEAAYLRTIAMERLKAGLDSCPSNARLLTNLGMVLEEDGDLVAATAKYIESIRSNINHARSWYYLARTTTTRYRPLNEELRRLRKRKNAKERVKELKEEVENLGNAILQQLGTDVVDMEVLQEKDGPPLMQILQYCFDQALKLSDDNPDWVKEYANFYQYTCSNTETNKIRARELYEQVLAKEPDHPLAMKNLARLHLDRADSIKRQNMPHECPLESYKAAEELYKKLFNIEQTPVIAFNLAKTQFSQFLHHFSQFGGKPQQQQQQDPSSSFHLLNEGLDHATQGFSCIDDFEEKSRLREYGLIRLFDAGYHASMASNVTGLLARLARQLRCSVTFIQNYDVLVGQALDPMIQVEWLDRLKDFIERIFEMIRRIHNVQIQNHDQEEKFKKFYFQSYIDHIGVMLALVDPEFVFMKDWKLENLQEMNSRVSFRTREKDTAWNRCIFQRVDMLLAELDREKTEKNLEDHQQLAKSLYLQYRLKFFAEIIPSDKKQTV